MKNFALLGTFVCFGAFAAPSDVDTSRVGSLFASNLSASVSAFDVNEREMGLDRLLDYSEIMEGKKEVPEVCHDIKPSDEQKVALKAAFKKHIREAIALKSDLKLAAMDFMETIENQDAGVNEGLTAAAAIQGKIAALVASKAELDVSVLFSILTPEQRQPAFACGMLLAKAKFEKMLDKACSERKSSELP